MYGAGALLGSTLVGCGRQQEPIAGSEVTVFLDGTILSVDAAVSEHTALANADNKVLVGLLPVLHLTQLGIEFVVGKVADGAGVE